MTACLHQIISNSHLRTQPKLKLYTYLWPLATSRLASLPAHQPPFEAVRRPAPGPGVVAKPAAGPVENAESEAKLLGDASDVHVGELHQIAKRLPHVTWVFQF